MCSFGHVGADLGVTIGSTKSDCDKIDVIFEIQAISLDLRKVIF